MADRVLGRARRRQPRVEEQLALEHEARPGRLGQELVARDHPAQVLRGVAVRLRALEDDEGGRLERDREPGHEEEPGGRGAEAPEERPPVRRVLERARREHEVVRPLEAGVAGVERHVGVDPRARLRDRGHLPAVPVQLDLRHHRPGEDGVVPEPAAPVEDGQALPPVGRAGEHVGERDEHVVGGDVVAREALPGACLVVDAERPGPLERRHPLRPFREIGVGDRPAVPARHRPFPPFRDVLELGRLRRRGGRLVGAREALSAEGRGGGARP